MTSTDAIIDALLSEAHETAENIIQNAKKTVHDTLEEQRKKGRERAREIVTSINKKAQNESVIIKLRDTASAESKAKWLILEKKHALIENVLNQVTDELLTLIETDKYLHILENLIVEGGTILDTTDLEVILNERDSTLQLDLDKLAEKIGERTGKKTIITKSEKIIDVIGGVIIQATGEDKPRDFYADNPSLKLIAETNTITKFKKVYKAYAEKQILPNIEDVFKLKVLEDILNNFKKIKSLEDRISELSVKSTSAIMLGNGKIVMNNTFESMLNNSESEIRFKIAQTLFT